MELCSYCKKKGVWIDTQRGVKFTTCRYCKKYKAIEKWSRKEGKWIEA